MATTSHFPQRRAPAPAGLPPVRVEVRHGTARPTNYDVTGEEFLIGSVPGCDLRLPGINLPPVVCLIARQTDGVRLRKLAPTLPVLVNGQPIPHTAATPLTHGDCISIGAVDVNVSIDFAVGSMPISEASSIRPMGEDRSAEFHRRDQDLRERERQLDEQQRELEADRILWYRRRDEIEQETRQAQQTAVQFDRSGDDLIARETRLNAREEEIARRQAEIQKQQEELLDLREQTLAARREMFDGLAGKRDELAQAQDSIRESLESVRKREESLEVEFSARRQAFEDELRQKRQQAEEELRTWHNHGASGLTHIREQVEAEVATRLKQRAEELDRFQLSLREAAVQLRERKQELDEQLSQYEPRRKELFDREETLARRQEEIEAIALKLQAERDELGLERKQGAEPLVQKEKDLSIREAEVVERLQKLDLDREIVDKGKSQYQNDLIRLDRWQVTLDEKDRQLQARAKEIDERFEQFKNDAADLEEQVMQIDARDEQIRAEEQRLNVQRDDLEQRERKVNERTAQVEGQQTMLAALRTRLEHMREEQREEAAKIADERARLDEHMRESQDKLRDAELLRQQLSGEQQGQGDSERLFRERSEVLQQAVQRLRDLQQKLSDDDERLRKLGEEVDTKSVELAEREGTLQARMQQLIEQQQRLEADRAALKQREESIFLTEGTRESLQDQLRRRAEDLITRGQELDTRANQIEQQAKLIAAQQDALERSKTDASGQQLQNSEHAAELARRDEELRLAQTEIVEQRRMFAEMQSQFERQKREAEERAGQARQEIEDLKAALARQATELFSQVPDLESRAQSALERTAQARESLRGQLSELHAYAKQSQDDLENVRSQVQAEIERLRQQETGLTRARSEHRHAVASFRQQLIEWQSRFSEMKQALSQGESRIERREKVVEETSQQLAKQAEELDVRQKEVADRRDEMNRHLNDMREWYRKKLRELVETRNSERGNRHTESVEEAGIIPLPQIAEGADDVPLAAEADPRSPVILSMHEDLDPADRKLGELMQSLELVDGDTLLSLWSEARRQHRPLRQVLLAGNYLTLYQLALIETGNVNGLVLGRFRVVDRMQSTPREAVYRVFDPQSADNADRGTCVLRHLAESEMHDAVRPDEYRQRFSAVRDIAHPNLAATREVLEINNRPAVVQEWLNGLPGSEFPAVAGVPGVWFRLLSQAALGLHTAHQAGLIHGRLAPDSLLFTKEGTLKIVGLGEPPWLHPHTASEPTAEDDIRALGRIVFDWSQQAPKKKGKKGMPESLLNVLRGLGAENSEGVPLGVYPSMAMLLEDLDKAGRDVPADVSSWEKLVEQVAESTSDSSLRQTG